VGDGEVRPAIERQIAECGVQDAVEVAGWQDDLSDVYRRMDVLVLTSRNEGTPVAVIEAMAAALPVIATAVGGVPDVVRHEETGLLVPSDAIEALTAAMICLARNRQTRERLGAAARESVGTRFAAERLVSDVAALYRSELQRVRSASLPSDRPS
jgi:glycosyltransferase involved in cell wall biosynthesis